MLTGLQADTEELESLGGQEVCPLLVFPTDNNLILMEGGSGQTSAIALPFVVGLGHCGI